MIKILWLTSVDIFNNNPNRSGTWITSMYTHLKHNSNISICGYITFSREKNFRLEENEGVKSYYVPSSLLNQGFPTPKVYDYIINAIENVRPDIIHVWGMETCLGLIACDIRLKDYKKIIDVQGIKGANAAYNTFYGGLSKPELRKMNGLLQYLLPATRLEYQRKLFSKWAFVESKILSGIKNVNTQSEWVRNVIPSIASDIKIFHTGIILRDKFLSSKPWSEVHVFGENPVLFTTTAANPHKGFHITLRAFALILKEYPNAILRVAGIPQLSKSRIMGGYIKYLHKLVLDLGISKNIVFLGNIAEKELLENMYNADLYICSSYIETYCLALAEAIAVGVPTVSSYTSAIPELVGNGQYGLLFPIGDQYSCAACITKYLKDRDFCVKTSINSSTWYRENHSAENAVEMQVKNYLTIYNERN